MSFARTARPFVAWLAILALLLGAGRPLAVQALRERAPDYALVLCSSAVGAERSADGAPAGAAHGHDLCCLLSCAPAGLPPVVHAAVAPTQALPVAVPRDGPARRASAPWTHAPSRGPPVSA